jgi:hypothetical protein
MRRAIVVLASVFLAYGHAHAGDTHQPVPCPDCSCQWLDAAGAASSEPVTHLPASLHNPTEGQRSNPFNHKYLIRSDPAHPCPPEGKAKTCKCMIVMKATWTEAKEGAQVNETVHEAGDKGLSEGDVNKERERLTSTYHKAPLPTVSLSPICAMLNEKGVPQYGQPH